MRSARPVLGHAASQMGGLRMKSDTADFNSRPLFFSQLASSPHPDSSHASLMTSVSACGSAQDHRNDVKEGAGSGQSVSVRFGLAFGDNRRVGRLHAVGQSSHFACTRIHIIARVARNEFSVSRSKISRIGTPVTLPYRRDFSMNRTISQSEWTSLPDPDVWTGRASQGNSGRRGWSCANVSGPLRSKAPGHHGYPRTSVLISGSALSAIGVTRAPM